MTVLAYSSLAVPDLEGCCGRVPGEAGRGGLGVEDDL